MGRRLQNTRAHQPDGTELTVEVAQDGNQVGVGYLLETTAEFDGVWDGKITVTDSTGQQVAEAEIFGVVDAFDEPPFTTGEETLNIRGAAEGDLTVEVAFHSPEEISTEAVIEDFDPGEGGFSLTEEQLLAIAGVGAVGVGAVLLRRRGGS